jgi:hypothetical protein
MRVIKYRILVLISPFISFFAKLTSMACLIKSGPERDRMENMPRRPAHKMRLNK